MEGYYSDELREGEPSHRPHHHQHPPPQYQHHHQQHPSNRLPPHHQQHQPPPHSHHQLQPPPPLSNSNGNSSSSRVRLHRPLLEGTGEGSRSDYRERDRIPTNTNNLDYNGRGGGGGGGGGGNYSNYPPPTTTTVVDQYGRPINPNRGHHHHPHQPHPSYPSHDNNNLPPYPTTNDRGRGYYDWPEPAAPYHHTREGPPPPTMDYPPHTHYREPPPTGYPLPPPPHTNHNNPEVSPGRLNRAPPPQQLPYHPTTVLGGPPGPDPRYYPRESYRGQRREDPNLYYSDLPPTRAPPVPRGSYPDPSRPYPVPTPSSNSVPNHGPDHYQPIPRVVGGIPTHPTPGPPREFNDPRELSKELHPVMKFTSFPIFPCPSSKNVFSSYSQVDAPRANDHLSTPLNPPYLKSETGELVELDLTKNTIIFHPGSRYLRLGYSSDPFPKECPHLIARQLKTPSPTKKPKPKPEGEEDELEEMEEGNPKEEGEDCEILGAIEWGENQLMERLQNAKRKPSSNAHSQVLNFNSAVEPTSLPDHNDPYRGDWTSFQEVPYLIGEKASKLPSNTTDYLLRYPLKYGKLNTKDYHSISEVRADLEVLWATAIQEYLELPIESYEGYSIGLVVPDQFCPVYVSLAIDIFLNSLGFFSIFLIQESVSATFGAGISSACVVNLGAQVASVACVEEGRCIPGSRVAMPMGGDDITLLLIQLLKRSFFPYPTLNLTDPLGWNLAETLKKQLINYKENELSVYLSYFFVPSPGKPTRRYELKVYDEGFIAPMLFFNPQVMDIQRQSKQAELEKPAPWITNHVLPYIDHLMSKTSQYDPTNSAKRNGKVPGPPPTTSRAQAVDDYDEMEDYDVPHDPEGEDENQICQSLVDPTRGIDRAIAQSIRAASTEELTSRRWYATILVAGGGAGLIPGFPELLTAYLQTSAPVGTNVEVLASVRDLDPRDLPWKGASVFSKLEVAPDHHINFKEWTNRGLHAVQEKSLFSWPVN